MTPNSCLTECEEGEEHRLHTPGARVRAVLLQAMEGARDAQFVAVVACLDVDSRDHSLRVGEFMCFARHDQTGMTQDRANLPYLNNARIMSAFRLKT